MADGRKPEAAHSPAANTALVINMWPSWTTEKTNEQLALRAWPSALRATEKMHEHEQQAARPKTPKSREPTRQ
jgi:hypothetical protein